MAVISDTSMRVRYKAGGKTATASRVKYGGGPVGYGANPPPKQGVLNRLLGRKGLQNRQQTQPAQVATQVATQVQAPKYNMRSYERMPVYQPFGPYNNSKFRSGYSNVTPDVADYNNFLFGLVYGNAVQPTMQEAILRQNAAPIGYQWTPTHGYIPLQQAGKGKGRAKQYATYTPAASYAGGGGYDYGGWDYGGGGGGGGGGSSDYVPQWYLDMMTWRI